MGSMQSKAVQKNFERMLWSSYIRGNGKTFENIPYGRSSAKLPVIMSSCHHVILPLCHLVIMSSGYIFNVRMGGWVGGNQI